VIQWRWIWRALGHRSAVRIDAHIHYVGDHPDCISLLARLGLKLLNVCVVHDHSGSGGILHASFVTWHGVTRTDMRGVRHSIRLIGMTQSIRES